MINYHTRKPIRNFLNQVTEPPYILTNEEANKHFEAIADVYEESTNEAREQFLIADTFDLLRTFAVEDNAIQHPRTPNDPHWLAMSEIRNMVCGLIACARQYGTRLPESELQKHGYDSLLFTNKSFAEFVRDLYEPTQTTKKPTSDTNGMEMGSNTTNGTETPQTAQKGANVAIMRPYTQKPVGRPANTFGDTIAAKYKEHVEIIQEYTRNELQSLNAPNAVVALFIAYRRKDILKQCPSYWATLRLLGIEAKTDKEAQKLCPFGGHHNYDDLRKKYFNKEDDFASLNETDSTQDEETSKYIQQAMEKAEALLKELEPPTELKEALQGA